MNRDSKPIASIRPENKVLTVLDKYMLVQWYNIGIYILYIYILRCILVIENTSFTNSYRKHLKTFESNSQANHNSNLLLFSSPTFPFSGALIILLTLLFLTPSPLIKSDNGIVKYSVTAKTQNIHRKLLLLIYIKHRVTNKNYSIFL